MKRSAALIHNLDKLKRNNPQDFEGIDIKCVEIYIDIDNSGEILEIPGNEPPLFRMKQPPHFELPFLV